jgi:hypothetical protein
LIEPYIVFLDIFTGLREVPITMCSRAPGADASRGLSGLVRIRICSVFVPGSGESGSDGVIVIVGDPLPPYFALYLGSVSQVIVTVAAFS